EWVLVSTREVTAVMRLPPSPPTAAAWPPPQRTRPACPTAPQPPPASPPRCRWAGTPHTGRTGTEQRNSRRLLDEPVSVGGRAHAVDLDPHLTRTLWRLA